LRCRPDIPLIVISPQIHATAAPGHQRRQSFAVIPIRSD
jgi:hypothetical protein